MGEPRRLYRSVDNQMIAGVCGGIADYLGWDATIVRIAYVLLTIFTIFSGVLIYIILWLIIPNNPNQ